MTRAIVVALVVALASPAHADECSAADARARAVELLGREPARQPLVEIDGLAARVTIDGAGTRTIAARDCHELVEWIALVIVMSAREEPAPQARDVEAPAIEAQVTPLPVTNPERDAGEPNAGSARVEGALIAGGALGVSSLAFDQRVSLGARIRRNELSIDALASMHRTDDTALGQGSITVSLRAFTIAPCAHLRSFAVCATGTAGWFTGRGNDLYEGRTERLVYAAAGARVGYEWQLASRLALAMTLDVDVPLLTSRFLVDQMPVWTNRRIEAWTGAAAVVKIP